ncbi:MAG: hypothetical protein OXC37_03600 [Bdellovibrionaceae bacterium]|nr:hypothetical protein [Pseudobdellovibrionaceae bacterium]
MEFSLVLKKGLFVVFIFLFSFYAHAVKVYFPDEELATESVLPLVDTSEVVLNRNIRLKFKTELSIEHGRGLDEPFYDKNYPTGVINFYFTEIHAISLMGTYYFPFLSSAGRDLSEGRGLADGKKFSPLKAPYPQYSFFLNYLYTPYYGKMSLAKKWVLNLSIYGFIGGGLVVSNKNDQFPGFDIGFGKKLYINKWIGLKTSIGFYSYYGPATARLNLDEGVGSLNYKNLKSDQKRFNINTVVHYGVFILL